MRAAAEGMPAARPGGGVVRAARAAARPPPPGRSLGRLVASYAAGVVSSGTASGKHHHPRLWRSDTTGSTCQQNHVQKKTILQIEETV